MEIAPAPGLGEDLRARILADAVKLVRAADYVNAGTVEFLVAPRPVITTSSSATPASRSSTRSPEQVTGIDLVEAQFHLTAGDSLASLGLADQQAVGAPRGFSVQARVVATGPGTITAYKEPTGPGVRVDGSGYAGYAPPLQFDPLLAKVISTSGAGTSVTAAVDRTLRALGEFHVAGLPTNLAQLRAILSHPAVRGGNARTTLLSEAPELMSASSVAEKDHAAIALLAERASAAAGSSGSWLADAHATNDRVSAVDASRAHRRGRAAGGDLPDG